LFRKRFMDGYGETNLFFKGANQAVYGFIQ